MNKKLWYTSPAEAFTEALPLGNGSLGAIVYGNVPRGRITVNYDTFWSGTGRKIQKEIDSRDLEYVRGLIFSRKFWEAEQFMKVHMLGNYNESYMPLGEIHYHFVNIKEFTHYSRTLNLEDGVLTTAFTAGGCSYKTEMFISCKDKAFVTRISASVPGSIQLNLSLTSKVRHSVRMAEGPDMALSGNAPSNVQPNYIECDRPISYDPDNKGMACCMYLKARHQGGQSVYTENEIQIKGASSVIMYVAAADGYRGFNAPLELSEEICIAKCSKLLEKALQMDFDALKERHVEDYQSVFKNVTLDLCQEERELPTDIRLKRFRQGEEDLGLYSLFFHYNRYLLVSSSRKGTQPANLQGIWNESLRPVWSSNWTININTQMNYWASCPCNLTECYEPLLSMLEELSLAGQDTAGKLYHCRGWAANHNVDLWRQTGPVGGEPKYAYWPMGGVWLSAQIYEYYKYTLDLDCLRERIFPVMRGSVLFCLDWLIPGADGKYYTAPSTSPESTFLDKEGRACGVSYGSTLDIGLMKELFMNFIEACQLLDREEPLLKEVEERLSRLPDYHIGSYGQLQEWMEDFEEADPGHRHFSPVFGFHPGSTIQRERDQELVLACKRFVERRVRHHGGQIGWSCAWLINLWARLGDGNQALSYLEQLLRNSVYDNLFDLHPPLGETKGEREVFQIDGNFGSASGVAGMLMDSGRGIIRLLPALPDQWENGSVQGLLAQGNILVNIAWEHGKLESADFLSPVSQTIKLHDGTTGLCQEISLEKNIRFSWSNCRPSVFPAAGSFS